MEAGDNGGDDHLEPANYLTASLIDGVTRIYARFSGPGQLDPDRLINSIEAKTEQEWRETSVDLRKFDPVPAGLAVSKCVLNQYNRGLREARRLEISR